MLTDLEVNLLYEIYEITLRENTVVSGGSGQSRLQPDIFSAGKTIKDRLVEAIAAINLSPSQIARVREILTEFKDISLDPSSIDQAGYSFRPHRNIEILRERLYPYTGILFYKGGGNRLLHG
jgi:hypothetical protein